MNFETAPFKLTSEYVALMGGVRSATFARFRELVIKGFLAARKHAAASQEPSLPRRRADSHQL